jgi:hypothetical protein
MQYGRKRSQNFKQLADELPPVQQLQLGEYLLAKARNRVLAEEVLLSETRSQRIG